MRFKYPYRYRVLIFLFFLIFITYLDRVCLSLVGVRIKSEFGITNEQFGWVLGAFALAYALFEIPSGIMGDRIGQRTVFMRIVLWWSLFTALTGFTTGLTTLIITRFLFGMGESGAFPNSSGTISRWFPAAETARSTSWLLVGANAGAAFAPLIIIPIASAYGWRAPFFVNGLIGILWVLVCYFWFRNNPAEKKKVSGSEIVFIEVNRRISQHRQIFPWKTALRNRSFWGLLVSYFCSQWGLYFLIAWMPVYLQEGRHFSENEMKMTTTCLFIVGIISSLGAGVLNDWLVKRKGLRFGRRYMGMLALIIGGLSILITAMTSSNAIVVAALMLTNCCIWANAISMLSVGIDIGGNYAGTVVGIMNCFGQIGSFCLAVVFGKLVDVTHGFTVPLYLLAFVLGTGGLTWLAVDAEKQLSVSSPYSDAGSSLQNV
ncbi:MAG TPA: MFS transporter [Puia sp.]